MGNINKVIFQRSKDKNYIETYANDANIRRGNDGTTRITFFEEYTPSHDFEAYDVDEDGNIEYNTYKGCFSELENESVTRLVNENNDMYVINRNEKVTLTLNQSAIIKLYDALKSIIE